MCEYFDYEVTKLERIQIMHIKLGNLPKGNWRDLTPAELEELFNLLEKSKDVSPDKKPAKSKKPASPAKPKPEAGSQARPAAKSKTGGSAPRMGKSKVSNTRNQPKQHSQPRRGRR